MRRGAGRRPAWSPTPTSSARARRRLDGPLARAHARPCSAPARPTRWSPSWRRPAGTGSPLVPQGGNTGLVGGSVPLGGEVVVDLRRLDALGPVDAAAGQVTVGRGRDARRRSRPTSRAARARPRRGPGGAGHRDDRRAWWPPTPAGSTSCATARCGPRCSGWRPCSAPATLVRGEPGRAGEGQHRLRPGRAALRERGHARHRHRGPPAAGADARRSRRRAPGASAPSSDAVAACPCSASLPDLHAVELVLRDGLRRRGRAPRRAGTARPGAGVRAPGGAGRGRRDRLLDQLAGALASLGPTVVDSAAADDPAGVDRLWRWREAHSEAAAALGARPQGRRDAPARRAGRVRRRGGPARRGARGARAPRPSSTATSPTATSTSTWSGPRADDERTDRRGARAGAAPRRQRERRARHRHGQAALAGAASEARRRSRPCGRSRPPSTRTGSSTPACCCPDGRRSSAAEEAVDGGGLLGSPAADRVVGVGRRAGGVEHVGEAPRAGPPAGERWAARPARASSSLTSSSARTSREWATGWASQRRSARRPAAVARCTVRGGPAPGLRAHRLR